MSNSKCGQDQPENGPKSDLAKLREIGVVCTADFVVQSSFAVQGSHQAPEHMDTGKQAVAGRFVGVRHALLGADDADPLITELREKLARGGKQTNPQEIDELVSLWAIAEQVATEEETAELWSLVATRLSNGDDLKPKISRSGNALCGGQ